MAPFSAPSDSGFPASIEEVSVEWLRACFDANGILGAQLLDFETARIGTGLIGDSYRLQFSWIGERPMAAPASLVLKLAALDPTSRATGIGLRNYEREVRFYRDVARSTGIRLARAWAAEWSVDDGTFALLLEDLSPAVVGDQLRGCSVADAETVIDVAAQLHACHWQSAALEPFSDWMSVQADGERAQQLQMLWTLAWPAFVDRHAHRLGASEQAAAEKFGAVIARWVQDRQPPYTLVHGDFRIDNMLFGRDSDGPWVVPVDWQTPGVGPGVGDVAYFLGASLLPGDRQAHEERLVRRWHERLVAHGVRDYDWATCWASYRSLCWGGAVMGVVASMLTPQTERGDDMFFAMASRHLRQALDLDALSALPFSPT